MIRRLSLVVACLGPLALGACSGDDDRDELRDRLLDQLDAQGFDADPECIDEVFDSFGDAEIEAAASDIASTVGQELTNRLLECVDVTGTGSGG